MSSLINPTPEKMAQYIRNHWAIENQLHWQLGITFGEDDAKVHKDNEYLKKLLT
jgi:predicted transposase YbfD/YdcC